MTTTKARPQLEKTRVRLRKMWTDEMGYFYDSKGTPSDRPAFIITGYTGSAKALKRLVEVAAMDEDVLLAMIRLALASQHDGAIGHDHHPELLRLLGLGMHRNTAKTKGRKS